MPGRHPRTFVRDIPIAGIAFVDGEHDFDVDPGILGLEPH